MFEFEIQAPTQIRVRIGRWHFRTWRRHFMRLPKGYISPDTAYVVEFRTDDEGCVQYGAFFTEDPAQRLMERLIGDGLDAERLRINMVSIYRSLEDHEWDR